MVGYLAEGEKKNVMLGGTDAKQMLESLEAESLVFLQRPTPFPNLVALELVPGVHSSSRPQGLKSSTNAVNACSLETCQRSFAI